MPSPDGFQYQRKSPRRIMPAADSESRAGAIQCFFVSVTMGFVGDQVLADGHGAPLDGDVTQVCRIEARLPGSGCERKGFEDLPVGRRGELGREDSPRPRSRPPAGTGSRTASLAGRRPGYRRRGDRRRRAPRRAGRPGAGPLRSAAPPGGSCPGGPGRGVGAREVGAPSVTFPTARATFDPSLRASSLALPSRAPIASRRPATSAASRASAGSLSAPPPRRALPAAPRVPAGRPPAPAPRSGTRPARGAAA